jgi:hypothetical protein
MDLPVLLTLEHIGNVVVETAEFCYDAGVIRKPKASTYRENIHPSWP